MDGYFICMVYNCREYVQDARKECISWLLVLHTRYVEFALVFISIDVSVCDKLLPT